MSQSLKTKGKQIPANVLFVKDSLGSGISASVPEPAKDSLLSELIGISNAIQNTIIITTARKASVDSMIKAVTRGRM